MTQTNTRATDRPTSRDASHLKTWSGLYGPSNWTFGVCRQLLTSSSWLNTASQSTLCNSWVTAWCSVYGDTECCILETESLSSSNRHSRPVPACWPHHHNHEDNVIEIFILLWLSFLSFYCCKVFCVYRLIKPLKRQNCSHIFEVDT